MSSTGSGRKYNYTFEEMHNPRLCMDKFCPYIDDHVFLEHFSYYILV